MTDADGNFGEERNSIVIGPDTTPDATEIKLASVSESTLSPLAFQTVELCMSAAYPKSGMCTPVPPETVPFKVKIKAKTLETSQHNIVSNEKELNIIDGGCDENTGCITVKYGGTYSGTYEWEIESTADGVGAVDTSDHEL